MRALEIQTRDASKDGRGCSLILSAASDQRRSCVIGQVGWEYFLKKKSKKKKLLTEPGRHLHLLLISGRILLGFQASSRRARLARAVANCLRDGLASLVSNLITSEYLASNGIMFTHTHAHDKVLGYVWLTDLCMLAKSPRRRSAGLIRVAGFCSML